MAILTMLRSLFSLAVLIFSSLLYNPNSYPYP